MVWSALEGTLKVVWFQPLPSLPQAFCFSVRFGSLETLWNECQEKHSGSCLCQERTNFLLLQNLKWVIFGLRYTYLDLHFLSPKQMGSPKPICAYFFEHWYYNISPLCMLWEHDFWKLECLLSGIILPVGDLFWTIPSNEDGGEQLFFPPFLSSQ